MVSAACAERIIAKVCIFLVVPLSDLGRLHAACSASVRAIIHGQPFRVTSQEIIERLSTIQKFILMAAFMCASNPTRFDLRLFGSQFRRGRLPRVHKSAKITSAMAKALRCSPKMLVLERLLAIFYFIYPSDEQGALPAMNSVYQAVGNLIERSLLTRVAIRGRLSGMKLRLLCTKDFVSMVAASVKFDLSSYLLVNCQ